MASIAPPHAATLQAAVRAPAAEPGPAAHAAERHQAQHAAAVRSELTPDNLQVRLDENAQRFVQTLTDANTAETVRRYPSESQLAYSRAVMAYLRTLALK
jgi:hypothetical protein